MVRTPNNRIRRFTSSSGPINSSRAVRNALYSAITPNNVRKVIKYGRTAGKWLKENMKNPFKSSGKKTTSHSGKSKWNNGSTGVYSGKFKKPKKFKKSVFTQALKYGYKYDVEEFGRVDDPNAVYITHSTKHVSAYANSLVGALIRKLLDLGGYPVHDKLEQPTLQLDGTSRSSDGIKIQYLVQDPVTQTVSSVIIFDSASGQSIQSMLSSAGLQAIVTHITEFIQNINSNEPYKLLLFTDDNNGAAQIGRIAASLSLQSILVGVNAVSKIVIQNRTAGDSALSTDKSNERVDNQPINGTLYRFNQSTPRTKYTNADNNGLFLSSVNNNGLLLVRSAQLENALQNAPDPRIWTNCSKKSGIILQPGTMKTSTISHNYYCSLRTFLLRSRSQLTDATRFVGGSGKSETFFFQETLRTNSSNILTVQYERHIEVGCFIRKTKKSFPIRSHLLTVEQSNLTQ
nr:MAG: putative capsid protein [Cressdnaviricota sp.]